jgi:hypothetical protein
MSYNLFGSTIPTNLSNAGTYTRGAVFTSLDVGDVMGVRFYKGVLNTGTHIGTLWSITGTNLAQVTFTGETASGWQYMAFGSPYHISAGIQYVVSYTCPTNFASTIGVGSVAGQVFGNPLSATVNFSRYIAGGSNTFPTNTDANNYFADLVLDNVVQPTAVRSLIGRQCVVGALQGVSFGGVTSIHGDTFDRHLKTGVREELSDGYPAPPCLALDYPGMWRFRWQVQPGLQTISCYAKQASNVTGKRPSMIVKANPALGLAADVVGLAGASTGWIKINSLSVTVATAGVLWVELWNNDTDTFYSTAFFDNIDV